MTPLQSLLVLAGIVLACLVLAAVAAVASLTIRHFLLSTWSISVYTWREGMRKKTLIGFLVLSILVIF
jgi:hypothetical protein